MKIGKIIKKEWNLKCNLKWITNQANFICLEDLVDKIECCCDKEDMENALAKINHAIQGLKDAIQTKRAGKMTNSEDVKNYVNCHRSHGKRLRHHQICRRTSRN